MRAVANVKRNVIVPEPNLTEIIIDGSEFNELMDRVSEDKLKTGGNPDPPILEFIELQLKVSSVVYVCFSIPVQRQHYWCMTAQAFIALKSNLFRFKISIKTTFYFKYPGRQKSDAEKSHFLTCLVELPLVPNPP